MRCDELCEGCDFCIPGGWACGRCDAIGTEDDPDYGGLCQECAGEDMAYEYEGRQLYRERNENERRGIA
jgi:hypothetical protein